MLQTVHLWNRTAPVNVGTREDRKEGSAKASSFNTPGGIIAEVAALLVPYRRILMGNG